MAKDEASQSDTKTSLGNGLSLIEKTWEWSWVMRVTTIVLFVDIALILKSGRGLLA
jgi:hypothetical protein